MKNVILFTSVVPWKRIFSADSGMVFAATFVIVLVRESYFC